MDQDHMAPSGCPDRAPARISANTNRYFQLLNRLGQPPAEMSKTVRMSLSPFEINEDETRCTTDILSMYRTAVHVAPSSPYNGSS